MDLTSDNSAPSGSVYYDEEDFVFEEDLDGRETMNFGGGIMITSQKRRWLPHELEPIDESKSVWTSRSGRNKRNRAIVESYPEEEDEDYVEDDVEGAIRVEDALWNARYIDLKAFQKKWGHMRVNQDKTQSRTLGNWIYYQKLQRKKGKLSKEKVGKLDLLGFEWEIGKSPAKRRSLNSSYAPSMSSSSPLFSDRTLNFQRKNQKNGEETDYNSYDPNAAATPLRAEGEVAKDVSSALEGELLIVPTDRDPLIGYSERTVDPNSSDKLNSIAIPGSNSNASSLVTPKRNRHPNSVPWTVRYKDLKAYQKIHGHCNVSKVADKKLGNWVTLQRQRRKLGQLAEEQILKLNKIAFEWRY